MSAGDGVFHHGTDERAGYIDLPSPAPYIEGDAGPRLDG
jgi:hypothetical protein